MADVEKRPEGGSSWTQQPLVRTTGVSGRDHLGVPEVPRMPLNCVLNDPSGARPTFVDVKPDTLLFDTVALEALLAAPEYGGVDSNKIKAIMLVHFAGSPCVMQKILALASQYGLPVIEDSAHALGAEFQGRKGGSDYGPGFQRQWVSCFSFCATKNITAGQKFYREKYSFQQGDYPVAERASDQVLSLPLYPAMRESDVNQVIRTVLKVIGI